MAEEDHRWMMETGTLSDFTIVCQGEKIRVHKVVLAMYSKYFEAMFHNYYKESKDGVVEFEDVRPDLMRHLLDYFYKGTTEWKVPKSDLLLHVELWILADRFEAKTAMLTIEKRTMAELKPFKNKTRVTGEGVLDLVVTHPTCEESAMSCIISEAAYVVLLDPKRQASAGKVKDAISRHHTLAELMAFWSAQYVASSSHQGTISLSAKGENVRDDVIAQHFTKLLPPKRLAKDDSMPGASNAS
ncbi:BTB/POZ domain-containing protein [Colletotrichum scovillei]|uniref:BTB/POZ domain-containing protein n=1 Tax=Colletotrichum scovillei TaxID=1209932 RepID=A0A9P7UJ00_9PEZI|nr:BTB/POZ domain-containing protein [Colletotrichum scovillei]KAG7076977.1 BTB/POZ domain-containing protein [Colletotrichum scovillei]KAG7084062.1 BTB/POZ domain-containing protein [Colletotrichum scovillei]